MSDMMLRVPLDLTLGDCVLILAALQHATHAPEYGASMGFVHDKVTRQVNDVLPGFAEKVQGKV